MRNELIYIEHGKHADPATTFSRSRDDDFTARLAARRKSENRNLYGRFWDDGSVEIFIERVVRGVGQVLEWRGS